MKGLLHYIWKNMMLKGRVMDTSNGKRISIISQGHEGESENLFQCARINVEGKELQGGVLINETGDEGSGFDFESKHPNDNVILMVTSGKNSNTPYINGKEVMRLHVELPEQLNDEFKQATLHTQCLPCHEAFQQISDININGFLSRLLIERIEEKSRNILQTLSECNGRWDDTLLRSLIRSFGFGIQSEVFDKWAKTLDMNALGKHRDNPIQVEAIMFGQAGLLEEESIPYYYRSEALKSKYYVDLVREYRFLKSKFNLKSIGWKDWGNGNATPHVRIARIAAIYSKNRMRISDILSCNTANEYYRMIDTVLDGYWNNHTRFGGTPTIGNGCMKQRQLDIIIINSIIPLLYTYGKHRNDDSVCSKAEDLLHMIKCEENRIIRMWQEKGVAISCAADSQAILQLERKYCRMRNCTECRLCNYYIRQRLDSCPRN